MTPSKSSPTSFYRPPHISPNGERSHPATLNAPTSINKKFLPRNQRQSSTGFSKFLATRMNESTSSSGPTPDLVPTLETDSESDATTDFSDENEEEEEEEDYQIKYASYAQVTKSTLSRLKPQEREEEEEEEDSFETSYFINKFSSLPLTTLTSYPQIESVILPSTLCSSCGKICCSPTPTSTATPSQNSTSTSTSIQETSSKDFVQLSCSCVICGTCLCRLINASSNDPPRKTDCFYCLKEVLGFVGVQFVDEKQGMKTPEKKDKEKDKFKYFPASPTSTIGLGGYGKREWSEEFSPVSTPSSSGTRIGSSTSSLKGPNAVVRVDNIPWDITLSEAIAWIPSNVKLPSKITQAISIHILCNRLDGRTLNQLYIELETLADAHALIRARDGGKLRQRPISVVLASQSELLETIFPAWTPGFEGLDALDSDQEGIVISNEDLEGLLNLCVLEAPHAIKVPERPFLQIATILAKFPWHQHQELVTGKTVAKIFKTVQIAVTLLRGSKDRFETQEVYENVLRVLVDSALKCPVFRSEQKSQILSSANLTISQYDFQTTPSFSTPSTPSTSSHKFKSSTIDRVQNSTSTPTTPKTPTRVPFTPSRYASMSTLEEDVGEKVDVEGLARELRVDVDVVRKVLEEGMKKLL